MEQENDLKLGKAETFDLVIAQSARAVIDVLISNTVKDESIVSAETKEEKSDDLQSPLEQPKILEGKRSRKPISRLDLSSLTPSKKEVSIPQVGNKKHRICTDLNHRCFRVVENHWVILNTVSADPFLCLIVSQLIHCS